jgi:SMC interacting uncharacterized protein involved in chromosome segregation
MLISASLTQKLRESFGLEAGDDMVDWMQRVGSEREHLRELNDLDFARHSAELRKEFAEARREMHADFEEFRQVVRADLIALREEMHVSVSTLREEMQASASNLREEMRAGFAEARAEHLKLEATIERRFNDMMRWSLLFWLSGLGAVVALLQLR